MFSRDQLTADDLTGQLQRPVHFIGNPFMDPVLTPAEALPSARQRIGLLPGSRRPELEDNLLLLLQLIEKLPVAAELSLDLALVASLEDGALHALAASVGWQLEQGVLSRPGTVSITVRRDAFQSVLQHSDLVIGMAGTAIEQAVGLARPALQLPGKGPQFTARFAEAQRRLLGPTVFCAPGDAGSSENIEATAAMALDLLKRSRSDQPLQEQCRREASRRLGTAGGGTRMAAAISKLLP